MNLTAIVVIAFTLMTGKPTPIEDMRAALRNLMSMQEVFYSQNMRYAGEVTVLHGYHAADKVTVRIARIHPEFQGYAAEATHAELKDVTCVVWVGTSGTPTLETKAEQRSGTIGRVVCDGDSAAAK